MSTNTYKTKIVECIVQHTQLDFQTVEKSLSECPDYVEGDFSFPCFALAKSWRKPPKVIAEELVGQLTLPSEVDRVVAVNGYINFVLNKKDFYHDVLGKLLLDPQSVSNSSIGNHKTITLDFSSPNMGKELAFHHLRGTMLGNSLSKIFKACGYHVVRINHLGDWGTSYGKLIVVYMQQYANKPDDFLTTLTIAELNAMYQQFSKLSQIHPHLEDEARKAFSRLEEGDPHYTKLWKAFRDTTLAELQRIYNILGVEFDDYTGEAFFVEKSKNLLRQLKGEGLGEISEGAYIIRLDEDTPPLLLQKQDGSTLYATRDICAAIHRQETYHFQENLYIVDNGQSLHFKQFFGVLKKMGYPWVEGCEHIPFGLILTKSESGQWERGKTRAGGSSLLRDVLEAATQKILGIIEEKNPQLEQKEETARRIGVGALVFNDLKNKRLHDIKFEWDTVLSFEGDTGPYVMNAYVRLRSILRKRFGEVDFQKTLKGLYSEIQFGHFNEAESQNLISLLSQWKEKIELAAKLREPAILGQYSLELAEKSHSFIHTCRVLGSTEEKERLLLVYCSSVVLGGTLELMGLPLVERM